MSKSALPCGAAPTICVARAVITASSKAFLVASTASSQPWTCAGVWAEAGTERARAQQARKRGTRERRLIREITREARSTFPERIERAFRIVVGAGLAPARAAARAAPTAQTRGE